MAQETYETVFSGTLAGQFVQTVQHVVADIATPVNPFFSALLIAQDILAGGISQAWLEMLPEDYKPTSLRVRRVSDTGGPTAILLASEFFAQDGQRTAGISSAQVNPLIVWIGQVTPEKTGRLFIPGVAEADIDGMMLVAGLVTAIQAFITAWINGGTLGGVDSYNGCIAHRTTGPPPHVFSHMDLIMAGQVSPLIGTQRRRLHPV